MRYDNNYYSYIDVSFLYNVHSNFKVTDPFFAKFGAQTVTNQCI